MMTRQNCLTGLGILLTSALFSLGHSETFWRFRIEPALTQGRPHIVAETTGPAQTIHVLYGKATPEGVEPISTETLTNVRRAHFEPPSVTEDTAMQIAVTTGTPNQEPFFRWRTLWRPEGRRLIDYTGAEGFEEPDDFDEYWTRARAELATVPFAAAVTRSPDGDTTTGLLFRAELASVRETTVVCWYMVPRDVIGEDGRTTGKKTPVVMLFPGSGAHQVPVDRTTSGIATLSVNIRHHGPTRDYWRAPVVHTIYNVADPENFFYRLAILDCLRAVEFLRTRPEIDTARIAAEGGSQGGMLSIATAALDGGIACVCSNVTAFTSYADGQNLALVGHQRTYRRVLESGETTATPAMRSLTLTDASHFARRLNCPTMITMGDRDPNCPYVMGIVIYNRIPEGVTKEFNVVPDTPHTISPGIRAHNARFYERYLLSADGPPEF